MLKVLSAAPVCGTAQSSLSMCHVFCIDLRGEAPGEIRTPREVRVAAAVAVPGRKDLSVGYFMRSGFRHFRLQG